MKQSKKYGDELSSEEQDKYGDELSSEEQDKYAAEPVTCDHCERYKRLFDLVLPDSDLPDRYALCAKCIRIAYENEESE